MDDGMIADTQLLRQMATDLTRHQIADGLSPQWDVDAVYMARATWQQILTPAGYKVLMGAGRTVLFGLDCLIDDRMAPRAYEFARVNGTQDTRRTP